MKRSEALAKLLEMAAYEIERAKLDYHFFISDEFVKILRSVADAPEDELEEIVKRAEDLALRRELPPGRL